MKNDTNLSRRRFLRSTGRAATAVAAVSTFAPAMLSAAPPSKTTGVGCIGLGTRGGDLINAVVNAPNVKVTAVCDVYGPHRQKGIERSQNSAVKTYVDYRELLADRNVDAVVIATPDHWHCQMVLDAVKAGKDIYCEKGFSRTLAEAKLMRDALKRSQVVFQLGHHARQATCAFQARQLLAKDVLGPITLVRTGRFKSTEPEHPNWRWYGYYDQWERPDPAKVFKEVNWGSSD
jgi:predicted dehydrogenase